MKKIILSFYFFVCFGLISNSQVDWKLSGNTVTTDSRLGTNNSHALIFETSNIERFRLTNDGKLGIGIGTPLFRFDLVGDMRVDGSLMFSQYLANSIEDKNFLFVDNTGVMKGVSLLGSGGLLQQLYSVECFPFTNADGTIVSYPAPTWISIAGNDENQSVMYTGSICPAKIGIGTSNPLVSLHVAGSSFSKNLFVGASESINPAFKVRIGRTLGGEPFEPFFEIRNNGEIKFASKSSNPSPFTLFNSSANKSYFALGSFGNIDFNYFGNYGGVVWAVRAGNNSDPQASEIAVLTSDGRWWCQGVTIKHVPFWPDFVFSKDYSLMPLFELEKYIKQNHHLPNFPSAETAATNGIDLEEMVKLLTLKIEELTLYTISIQKELESLKSKSK
jgi:hypothetical protein